MAGAMSSARRISDVATSRPSVPAGCLYFTYVQRDTGIVDVGHDRQLAKSGNDFAQKFDSLASEIDCLVRQTGGVAARPRETLRPAILDRDIATFRPTEFAQSLHKGSDPFPLARRRALAQEPDGRHSACLL